MRHSKMAEWMENVEKVHFYNFFYLKHYERRFTKDGGVNGECRKGTFFIFFLFEHYDKVYLSWRSEWRMSKRYSVFCI